jgi:tetratricopeptide (TPR) repeat protein
MSKRNLHLAAPGGKAASAESIYKPRPLNNAEFDIRNNNIQNIWKAILLARKGRLGECGALCDKILSEETSSESFLLLKAKILFDAGNFAQALMIYEQVLKRMPYLQEASIMECACKYASTL